MRKIASWKSIRAIAAIIALAAGMLGAPGAAGARVVLVGVDGATWSVIDPLIDEGVLPRLAALAERGVTAELATVEPVISPVVWSSIATGRSPEAHGVSDFLKTGLDLEAPTVFERLAAKGRRVGLHEYLLTWPPRTLPGGFVVPAWLRRDERTTPKELGAGLSFRYTVDGLRNRAEYRAMVARELAEKAGVWNRLAERFDVEVGAVTFYGFDALGHRFWNEPAVLRETMIGLDAALGEIADGMGEDDSLLIASDHGFQAGEAEGRTVWSGTLEDALAKTGLREGEDAFMVIGEFGVVAIRVNAGPFAEREPLLERLRGIFEGARNAEGEALFTVDVLDEVERPPGYERGWLEWARQWVVRKIASWRFNARFDPNAHAYLIAQYDGDAWEAAWPEGEVRFAGRTWPVAELATRDAFTGTHHPTAVFLAAGGPVRAVAERGELSVLDVAPLVAVLAGEAVPDDMEGRVPVAWLRPEWLAAHPVRRVPAAEWPELPRVEGTDLPVDDADLLERLRTMGYVE